MIALNLKDSHSLPRSVCEKFLTTKQLKEQLKSREFNLLRELDLYEIICIPFCLISEVFIALELGGIVNPQVTSDFPLPIKLSRNNFATKSSGRLVEEARRTGFENLTEFFFSFIPFLDCLCNKSVNPHMLPIALKG